MAPYSTSGPTAGWLPLFIRVAISAGFLSAVADRFGLWGAAGAAGVAWGNFDSFVTYTGQLTPWAPRWLVPALAWIATVLEVLLGLQLLIGLRTRVAAVASGVLLLSFAFGMLLHSGPKAPLDYSVVAAASAAFALAVLGAGRLSVDRGADAGN
jgi:uncharacterized membrane protein YphA (DoxX/SURF4 family)